MLTRIEVNIGFDIFYFVISQRLHFIIDPQLRSAKMLVVEACPDSQTFHSQHRC